MTLIYAFMDVSGVWYGDVGAGVGGPEPGRGLLAVPADGQGALAVGQFAGQLLRVLYGECDLEASATTYRLEGGEVLAASRRVHELLAQAARPTLKLELRSADRRYGLDAELLASDRIELNIVISSGAGEIHGDLTGELDVVDLAELARLLSAAAHACPAPAPASPVSEAVAPGAGMSVTPAASASRQGVRWTAELSGRLRAGYEAGQDIAALAAAFDRSESAIRWKLHHLKLIPFPDDLVPEQRGSTKPEQPKAYTVDDKREEHANAYRRWTPQEDQDLARRSAEGALLAELVEEFGRNEGAIVSRLKKVGASGPAAEEAVQRLQ
ncbi:hypothetical protein [Streptomyces sp. NPDC056512]|uniref:hypothetical protein n=1 Tax=Streptomyces sp. NPDC056512 TaxID=3345846 RepID=UPI0036A7BC20